VAVGTYHVAFFNLGLPQRPQSAPIEVANLKPVVPQVVEIHDVVGKPAFAVSAGLVLLLLNPGSKRILLAALRPYDLLAAPQVKSPPGLFDARITSRVGHMP
jgi:hypothetical protein